MAHVSISPTVDNQETILTSLDRMEFISLLSRMLTLDPNQRIRPSAALQMPFITMQHLAMHTHTPSVWEWIQCMQICHQSPPTNRTPHTSSPIQLLTPGCCGHVHFVSNTPTILPSHIYSVVPTHAAHLVRPHTLLLFLMIIL